MTTPSSLSLSDVSPAEARASDLSHRLAWSILAVAVLVGICARLWYLQHAMTSPTFAWTDPDGYMNKSRFLFSSGSWEWAVEAVQYKHRGRIFYLPPLYPLFLSVFGLLPWSWPTSAAVAQAFLPAVTSGALYAIGATMHSRVAGLVAAVLVSVAPAFLTVAPVFMQELLYLPLLFTALAMLVWLLCGNRRLGWWALGGLLFGLAVLTRSMPLYFLPVAAACVIWWAPDRRRRMVEWGVLAGGLLVVTLAYSAVLSRSTGRWIFVEDHAFISLTAYTGIIYSKAPGLALELADLADAALRSPQRFLGTFTDFFTATFKLAGARWVQLNFASVIGTPRVFLEAYAVVLTDVVFVLSLVLAPLGALLARRQLPARVLAVWPVIVVLLTTVAAYGGPRYRSPFEVLLLSYLGVVVARGSWRTPARLHVVAAACVSLVLFFLVL